jgi:hypothetical protein
MIEKLLKRFMSDTGKMVLEATYKWADMKDGEPVDDAYEPMTMYENALACGTWIDKRVLTSVVMRLRVEHAISLKRRKAEATAAKILMGETFNEKGQANQAKQVNPNSLGGLAAQHPYANQQAYQQAQYAKQMYAQQGLGNLGNTLTGTQR